MSQQEDDQTRREEDGSLPEFGKGLYGIASEEAKAAMSLSRSKERARKDELRRAKALNENDALKNQLQQTRADLEKSKRNYGKIFYQNKILKAELVKIERLKLAKLSWDVVQILRAANKRS